MVAEDECVLPEFSDGRREVLACCAGVNEVDRRGDVRLSAERVVRPTLGRVPPVVARGPRQLGRHRRHEVVDRPREHDDVEDVQPGGGDQSSITNAFTDNVRNIISTIRGKLSKLCKRKRKGKEEYLYSAFLHQSTHKALRHGQHSFTCKQHHACLSFVAFTRCHHHSN